MIGIFGGTFDPIHYGHLRSAIEVKEIFGLEHIRLIPSGRPPHRKLPFAKAQQRVDMLQIAIDKQPWFICDTRELDRKGNSYTVDTLQSLCKEFPGQTFLLFIGYDAFNSLTTWFRWQHLFDYAHVVVLTRPGFELKSLDNFFNERRIDSIQQLYQTSAGKLYFQPVTPLAISATAIRHMIAQKKSPAFLLPDAVINYIKQHHLYEPNMAQAQEIECKQKSY